MISTSMENPDTRHAVLQNLMNNAQIMYGINPQLPEFAALSTWAMKLDYARLRTPKDITTIYNIYELAALEYVRAITGSLFNVC